jgi:hypothetical protein
VNGLARTEVLADVAAPSDGHDFGSAEFVMATGFEVTDRDERVADVAR